MTLKAQTLRNKLASRDILENVRSDGVVTRCEKSTGSFPTFNYNKTVRTYFKPNDGVTHLHRQAPLGQAQREH
ncbi:MAG: hypothetical protein AAB209_02175 [Bacteroidota bacterium]